MNLLEQKCEPCRGGTPPLSNQQAQVMMGEIPGWTLKDISIERTFQFRDFKEAIDFVNKQGENRAIDAQNQRPFQKRFHPRCEN
jgi:4a-hydroxytetrahydrobiopterin dehydratase